MKGKTKTAGQAADSKGKIVHVGCAIIRHRGRILIARRKPGTHLGGYWEFPGGKMHAGEGLAECLVREAREELGVVIRPAALLRIEDHAYPEKTVRLYFYFCDWVSGNPVPHDCMAVRWIRPEELSEYRFPPADASILNDLSANRARYFGPAAG